MSDFGVEPDDMTRSVLIDDKLDALLAGREPAPGDDLAGELSLMLGQLQQSFPPSVLSEHVEDAHIARIIEAAVRPPAVEATGTAVLQAPLLDRLRAGLSRRIAAATLAFTTAFGGAAYAGVLPKPIQREVAKLAAVVGLDLPDGDRGSDMRLPVPDEDEGDDGARGTEREPDQSSFDGADEERPGDGDAGRGGADPTDRDPGDDSDLDSEDRETDHNETDDLPEDDDGAEGRDSGDPEERESEDSEDPIDNVEDEDATKESSDPGPDPEELEPDPIEVED